MLDNVLLVDTGDSSGRTHAPTPRESPSSGRRRRLANGDSPQVAPADVVLTLTYEMCKKLEAEDGVRPPLTATGASGVLQTQLAHVEKVLCKTFAGRQARRIRMRGAAEGTLVHVRMRPVSEEAIDDARRVDIRWDLRIKGWWVDASRKTPRRPLGKTL